MTKYGRKSVKKHEHIRGSRIITGRKPSIPEEQLMIRADLLSIRDEDIPSDYHITGRLE